MASIPAKITKFKPLEQDFSTSIAQALWIKANDLAYYVEQSLPIGMLMFFEGSQSNLPSQPDAKYWKFCDGTAVVNSNSPLNGVVVPDFRDKFFRQAGSGEMVFSVAGSDTKQLLHFHVTESTNDRDAFEMDNGEERYEGRNHRHILIADSQTFSTIPSYHGIQVYIRIA